MHARVVRFDGVSRETIDRIVARIEEEDGPPPGVPATSMKMLYDEEQKLLNKYPQLGAFADEHRENAIVHFKDILFQGFEQWKSFALSRSTASSSSAPPAPPAELHPRPFKLRRMASTGRPTGLTSNPRFGAGPKRSKVKRR